ncbi:peroxiredoxin [Lactococcus nasutitermitis]|uniref:Peroxiredoxin n=1 Tax=Lactococcus nasutitermitis TaxID=1652957 RepID=A0ABV9JIN3_9LACT|nr:peroxiredoxin [Lactococcus nasutitermitis]
MTQEIKINGEKVATINPVTQGKAPDFTLPDLSGSSVTLSKLTKPVLLSIFPDINTSTCSLQTKHFNLEASEHQDIDFLSISNNTADEQRNWCAAEDIDMTILSDNGDFAKAYGLLINEGPLTGRLARSVFVIKNGEIIYSEIVNEITAEPNYSKALAAIK